MVQATDRYTLDSQGHVNAVELFEQMKQFYAPERFALVDKAFHLSKLKGEQEVSEYCGNYFQYGIEVAAVLFELSADEEAIAAGLLTGLYEADLLSQDDVLGITADISEVNTILKGISKMSEIRTLQNAKASKSQVDQFRKMLLMLVGDVRIVLVKLAEKVCLMRAAKVWTEAHQQHIAQEVLDIYAPLANRLGLSQIKWELEDRAFRYLHKEHYMQIANHLGMKRLERQHYIEQVMDKLNHALKKQGIEARVSGRAKHIYSIWNKMQKKRYQFSDLKDLYALRILVDNVEDCYEALSVLNSLWESLPKEFSDYIATPKPNGYRSVHAVYFGPGGQAIEVQIRTFEMHQNSELGVAAHWRYKENARFDSGYEAKIQWLRSLMAWQESILSENAEESVEVAHQLVDEHVYAFTPQGDVHDLPLGSTTLDFAYYIHTNVGHRCRGAKINGRIVPLTTQLRMGDVVEIITGKEPNPGKDWCVKGSGYVFSSKIRARIARWFKAQNREQHARDGREKLMPLIKEKRLSGVDYSSVAEHFNMSDEEGFFAAVGSGTVGVQQALNYLEEKFGTVRKEEVAPQDIIQPKAPKKNSHEGLIISGVNNLLSHMAGCCKPVFGDQVQGYITQGRGVTVHRTDCQNFIALRERHAERLVDVIWGDGQRGEYPVEIVVRSHDHPKFPSDVFSVLAADKISVLSTRTKNTVKDGVAEVKIRLSVTSVDHLHEVCNRVRSVRQVIDVERIYL